MREAVSPAGFIPIAETIGLINRLTLWVLRHAIGQTRAWLDDGNPVTVAVNLSPATCSTRHCRAGHRTAARVRATGHPAALEVTETAVMANPVLALSALTRLHELGIMLSIDDFGTGYSAMACLKRLPIDGLTMDQGFVFSVDSDPDDAVLVWGAGDLGHNLGLTVVAEGVETAAHVAVLRWLGCDAAQGFHYARPLAAGAFTDWLQQRTGQPVTVAVTPR